MLGENLGGDRIDIAQDTRCAVLFVVLRVQCVCVLLGASKGQMLAVHRTNKGEEA